MNGLFPSSKPPLARCRDGSAGEPLSPSLPHFLQSLPGSIKAYSGGGRKLEGGEGGNIMERGGRREGRWVGLEEAAGLGCWFDDKSQQAMPGGEREEETLEDT